MKDISKQNLEKLLKEHTQKEAAEIIGCSVSTVGNRIRQYGIDYKHKGRCHNLKKTLPQRLSELQEDVFVGSMLGDGHVDRRGRFKIEQSLVNQVYVDELFEVFHPFSTALRTVKCRKPNSEGKIDDESWGGEYLFRRRFQTYKHGIFECFRENWYPSEKKVVPKNICLNSVSLLHWFCQDGSNTYGMIRLHTNGFEIEDVEFLSSCLKRDLDIDSHIVMHYENPVIVIGSMDNGCNYKLIKMLRPQVNWGCFDHKVYWDETIRRRTKRRDK